MHDRLYVEYHCISTDHAKSHNELGWLPETMFEDGIKMTVKCYLNNRPWWENIINVEYQHYYQKMYSNR